MESVLKESMEYISQRTPSPTALPMVVRKHFASCVTNSKNNLESLSMAGDGWRDLLLGYCSTDAAKLNTPKSENLSKLYQRYLGIEDLAARWSCSASDIDDFVTLRGSIAHKGSSKYVAIGTLRDSADMIYQNCLHFDGELCAYLHQLIGGNIQPWRRATN